MKRKKKGKNPRQKKKKKENNEGYNEWKKKKKQDSDLLCFSLETGGAEWKPSRFARRSSLFAGPATGHLLRCAVEAWTLHHLRPHQPRLPEGGQRLLGECNVFRLFVSSSFSFVPVIVYSLRHRCRQVNSQDGFQLLDYVHTDEQLQVFDDSQIRKPPFIGITTLGWVRLHLEFASDRNKQVNVNLTKSKTKQTQNQNKKIERNYVLLINYDLSDFYFYFWKPPP